MLIKDDKRKPGWKGTCAIGLQVGTRTFTDTGITVSGVFGLVGWEEPCNEPIVVRCQLALQGKPIPYYWLACANPLHQRDAWVIEHLDADGQVTHTTQGIRTIETYTEEPKQLSYENRWQTPTATPIKRRKRKKKVDS